MVMLYIHLHYGTCIVARFKASERIQNKGNKRPLGLYMQEEKERKKKGEKERMQCQCTVQTKRKDGAVSQKDSALWEH